MVAHHTVGGCNLRPGDMLGTGTISCNRVRACLQIPSYIMLVSMLSCAWFPTDIPWWFLAGRQAGLGMPLGEDMEWLTEH